jgi:8-oxo-dGTP pyrophosphatase MutT (NUDIX family)
MSPVAATGALPSAVLVVFFMASAGLAGPSGADGRLDGVGEQADWIRSNEVTGSGERELHVLLTRRSWGLRTNSGEMAFPGGRCELDESTRDAAVREAWEETALDPEGVETLGELDHLTTVTRRAYIVPQVAVIEAPMDLRANPAEVEQILPVPVSELLRSDVYREEQWGVPGQHRPIYFFELIGNTVWGATAAILRQCLAMLVGADPGSLVDLDPARMAPKGYRMDPTYRNRVV